MKTTFKQAMLVLVLACIAGVAMTQAGCVAEEKLCPPYDCDEAVRAAVEATQQNKPSAAVTEEAKKLAEAGAQCLLREEGARKAKELEEKTKAQACDAHLIGSYCMDNDKLACPFDPQRRYLFKTLSAEDRLAMSYAQSRASRHCREHVLKNALDCPDGENPWSEYTREQVQARYDCLQDQYYQVHKDVVLYQKPLGMDFASWDEELPGTCDACAYEPALRVVMETIESFTFDGVDPKTMGVSVAQVTAAYQLRFKEVLDFYEAKGKVREGGGEFNDIDGDLGRQLCELLTAIEYVAYPDPLKGVTRAEMAERLKCEEE